MTIDCAFMATVHRAEQKTSASGKQYLRLSVRVGDGDSAQWVSVMAFDPEAIAAAERFEQGARCYVEGKLSLSEWTDREGNKKTGLNVMSWHTRLPHIGKNRPKRTKAKPAGNAHENQSRAFYDDPIPF